MSNKCSALTLDDIIPKALEFFPDVDIEIFIGFDNNPVPYSSFNGLYRKLHYSIIDKPQDIEMIERITSYYNCLAESNDEKIIVFLYVNYINRFCVKELYEETLAPYYSENMRRHIHDFLRNSIPW